MLKRARRSSKCPIHRCESCQQLTHYPPRPAHLLLRIRCCSRAPSAPTWTPTAATQVGAACQLAAEPIAGWLAVLRLPAACLQACIPAEPQRHPSLPTAAPPRVSPCPRCRAVGCSEPRGSQGGGGRTARGPVGARGRERCVLVLAPAWEGQAGRPQVAVHNAWQLPVVACRTVGLLVEHPTLSHPPTRAILLPLLSSPSRRELQRGPAPAAVRGPRAAAPAPCAGGR